MVTPLGRNTTHRKLLDDSYDAHAAETPRVIVGLVDETHCPLEKTARVEEVHAYQSTPGVQHASQLNQNWHALPSRQCVWRIPDDAHEIPPLEREVTHSGLHICALVEIHSHIA